MQRRVKIKRPFKKATTVFAIVASDHIQHVETLLKDIKNQIYWELFCFWISPLEKTFSIATIVESTHMYSQRGKILMDKQIHSSGKYCFRRIKYEILAFSAI